MNLSMNRNRLTENRLAVALGNLGYRGMEREPGIRRDGERAWAWRVQALTHRE